MTARTLADLAAQHHLVDELRELIGEGALRVLQSFYANRRVYIPMAAEPTHPLAVLLGDVLFGRLVARFGGDTLELPGCWLPEARRAIAIGMAAAGATMSEVAAELGVSLRRVRQILAEAEAEHALRGGKTTAMERPGIEPARSSIAK